MGDDLSPQAGTKSRKTMKRICLLRGINVGGKSLKMAALVDCLSGLGLHGLQTYVQSGNAVFDGPKGTDEAWERKVETTLLKDMGLKVSVVIRTGAEMAEILRKNPF